jgi:hypothetical protein
MATFDCSKDMDAYHDDKVTLSGDDQTEMRKRRNSGRTRLNNGLERDGFATPDMYSQGSYRMHTMVQDAANDYDIDDGAYFDDDDLMDKDGVKLTPRAARERVCKALCYDQRFADPAKVHTNCVRQVYTEGYHIDVPVYRVTVENEGKADEKEVYELASGDAWTFSDARAVTRWFEDEIARLNKAHAHEAGAQLRRLVRLTKKQARSRDAWKSKTCSGIVITRLVVDEFVPAPGRDDEALRETWKKIQTRLNRSTIVEHPVNASRLAEENDTCVRFFRDKLSDALTTLAVLDNCTRGEARKAWDTVYDTSFFSSRPSSDGKGTAAISVVSSGVDRRDDGGGRYG